MDSDYSPLKDRMSQAWNKSNKNPDSYAQVKVEDIEEEVKVQTQTQTI